MESGKKYEHEPTNEFIFMFSACSQGNVAYVVTLGPVLQGREMIFHCCSQHLAAWEGSMVRIVWVCSSFPGTIWYEMDFLEVVSGDVSPISRCRALHKEPQNLVDHRIVGCN